MWHPSVGMDSILLGPDLTEVLLQYTRAYEWEVQIPDNFYQ